MPRDRPSTFALFAAAVVAGLQGACGFNPLAPPDPGPDGAFEDCPCLVHDTAPENITDTVEWFTMMEGHVVNGRIQLQNGRTAPRDYGSGQCKTWDQDGSALPVCDMNGKPANSSTPGYCTRYWCYVDPENCHERRRPVPSALLEGMYYSYTTCGNIDETGPRNFKTDSDGPPIVIFNWGHDITPNPTGRLNSWRAMVKFTYEVLQTMKVNISADLEQRSLSESWKENLWVLTQDQNRDLNASNANDHHELETLVNASYSEYTACAYDLALGHLDMCVGDFWDTPERQAFRAPFSTTVYSEMVYLYYNDVKEELSFWQMLSLPLEPFSGGLWALICGVVVASGLAMVLFEYQVPEGDFADTTIHGALEHCSYLSFLSLFNAGLSFNPKTSSGKIFAVGFGLFICITIASFTANTASFLIAEARFDDMRSLSHALEQAKKVCAMVSLKKDIVVSYPSMERQGQYFSTFEDVISAVKDGTCEVALLAEPGVAELHNNAQVCSLQRKGRPVISYPTGMFVSERIQHSFNWAVADKRFDGTWTRIEADLYPPSTCGEDSEPTQGPQRLEARHMLGNCCLLLVGFFAALGVKVLTRMEKSIPGHTGDSPDGENPQSGTVANGAVYPKDDADAYDLYPEDNKPGSEREVDCDSEKNGARKRNGNGAHEDAEETTKIAIDPAA